MDAARAPGGVKRHGREGEIERHQQMGRTEPDRYRRVFHEAKNQPPPPSPGAQGRVQGQKEERQDEEHDAITAGFHTVAQVPGVEGAEQGGRQAQPRAAQSQAEPGHGPDRQDAAAKHWQPERRLIHHALGRVGKAAPCIVAGAGRDGERHGIVARTVFVEGGQPGCGTEFFRFPQICQRQPSGQLGAEDVRFVIV